MRSLWAGQKNHIQEADSKGAFAGNTNIQGESCSAIEMYIPVAPCLFRLLHNVAEKLD